MRASKPPAPGAADAPRLAIVTVTHDSAGEIGGWLAAAEAVRDRVGAEICVVDSGSSTDELARMREIAAGRLDHLVLRPNLGYGASCNTAARATTAGVLLFTNPDTRLISVPEAALAPGALEGTILGGFVVDGHERRSGGFVAMPSARRQAAQLVFGRRAMTYARTRVNPMWVSGGTLMVTREDLRRLGGWAEDYFLYFEDADLCLRHRRRGGAIDLSDDLLVKHPKDADRSHLAGLVFRSGRRFVARYQARRYAAVLWLCLVAGYLPRRVLLMLIRGSQKPGSTHPAPWSMVLDTLAPSRIDRRLIAGLTGDPACEDHGARS